MMDVTCRGSIVMAATLRACRCRQASVKLGEVAAPLPRASEPLAPRVPGLVLGRQCWRDKTNQLVVGQSTPAVRFQVDQTSGPFKSTTQT